MYSLVYAIGFDPVDGDALGGRCVEDNLPSLAEAERVRALYTPVARRLWGKGMLLIMDDTTHELVLPGQDDRACLAASN